VSDIHLVAWHLASSAILQGVALALEKITYQHYLAHTIW